MAPTAVERLRVRAESTSFFLALTCVFGGLQGVFCVILPMGSPYLISLGFSKSTLALIWLAGPVIGALAQPYFGFCSDSSRLPMGKRRPFILLGAVGTIVSLLGLAWVRDIVVLVGHCLLGVDELALEPVVLFAAAMFLWGALLFVQPIQAGARALIVDVCTTEQQGEANAWASRVTGLGNVFGYTLAYTDMTSWFAAEQNAQFKAVSIFVSALLALTVAVCCVLIREKDPRLAPRTVQLSAWRQIGEIFWSASRLSPQVKAIFKVQLCAWFGWKCFLFYTTTWIGELLIQAEDRVSRPDARQNGLQDFQTAAMRAGSLAFLLNSLLNLLTAMFAPALMELGGRILSTDPKSCISFPVKTHLHTPFARMRTGWMFSQLLFSLCMLSTFFISSVCSATAMVAVLGISTALSIQVIPYTMISKILSLHQDSGDPEDGIFPEKPRYEYRPGTVLGLHNIAICLPQLLADFGSSFIFSLGNGAHGNAAAVDPENTAWILRAGGFASLLAVYMASKIRATSAENITTKEVYSTNGPDDGMSLADSPRRAERRELLEEYE